MSLSAVLTAVAEYVSAAVVDADRPEPDRVLRYHGELPHHCCTENGLVAVNWTTESPYKTFPLASGGNSNDPCPGRPMVTIQAKYVVCWPALQVSSTGIVLADDDWDTRSAMLADVADSVTRALLHLSCEPDLGDSLVAAVLDATGRDRCRFVDAVPITPQGLCAGVRWRLYAGVRQPTINAIAIPDTVEVVA